jgi:GH15 family glucan-1,4-alpha-glucosidase
VGSIKHRWPRKHEFATHTLFERILALRNHLGLLSEEYDSTRRRQISNFPQAFSHLALIRTAINIERSSARGQLAA